MLDWQTKSSKVVYENPWMVVHEDEFIRHDEKEGIYGYYEIAGGGFTYIVPIDENMNTYITRQYRYPLKEESWEFASGQIDHQDPAEAAKRELLEETGLSASSVIKIGDFYADTGISSGRGTVHIATGIQKATDELDAVDGILEAKMLPFTEVGNMIARGEIKCPHTISSYFLAKEYLKKEGSK